MKPLEPLVSGAGLDRLRAALTPQFSLAALAATLELDGQALLARGDRTGVRRYLDHADSAVAATVTLIRLFLLGDAVAENAAAHALAPFALDEAAAAGLLECSAGAVRALVDLRPYGQDSHDGGSWWVVSDFGSDVRRGPLRADHVLGIGSAALTLAQSTTREPVTRALDVGTGCGIQALHLAEHAAEVVASDISPRALRFAATTAALSGQSWQLRSGSLLAPVAGERFDLVVANPPFVVSPGLAAGSGGYDYRDSGAAGDAVSRQLVRDLPGILAPGGMAQLLANWIIPSGGNWSDRVAGWFDGLGCDAWVWQREVADPAEYVAMWLLDAGHRPGDPDYDTRYNDWLDWFGHHGVLAVGMGLITMWITDGDPVVVCEDVRQPLGQPVGRFVRPWHDRQVWLREATDEVLLTARLRADADLVIERADVHAEPGWRAASVRLRQSHGLRWDLESDGLVAALVRGCDGTTALATLIAVLAASTATDAGELAATALPVMRDLVARGILHPARPA